MSDFSCNQDQEAAPDDPPVDKYNVEAAEALANEALVGRIGLCGAPLVDASDPLDCQYS